ncbi:MULTISPECIES: hypothetical protein [Actinosynnema]|uniref:hypothetical protein n=1 Tax=Actinosynnema TaxID=40566 RepID=UPI0020A23AC2|nr:hypothetical protein [Actinosynnema pretiosum]MCP2095009.1 Protein kinase domain-containing protein [Actinosynnema pretiosum]
MTTSRSSTSTSGEGRRAFPSGAAYAEALQNTALCFRGTALENGLVRTDALGRPRAISGNFASVFSVTTPDGAEHAVKCFTREVPEQADRYRAVGAHLAHLRADWAVGFEHVDRGVLVAGAWYPVLRMEWVRARNLIRWIEDTGDDKVALSALAARFAALAAELEAGGVGHGDLQHGNVLVTDSGALRLVDYDGMHVPALAGRPADEVGHRNYQSPDRTRAHHGPTVDRFSAWVVHLSLVALSVDPSLWRLLRDEDAEHLLLAEPDFADPGRSYRLATLIAHPDPRLRAHAERFRDVLLHHRAAPPPLEPVDTTPVGVAAPGAATAVPVVAGATGTPAWLAERLRPHAPAVPEVVLPTGGVLDGQVLDGQVLDGEPLTTGAALDGRGGELVRFGRKPVLLMALTWLLLLGASALPLAAELFLGLTGPELTAPVLLIPLLPVAAAVSYRRRPERVAAKAARRARRRARSAHRALAVKGAGLRRAGERLEAALRQAETARDREQRELADRHKREVAERQADTARLVVEAERAKQALARTTRDAEEKLLAQARKAHVLNHLARFPLRGAGIEGIGEALTAKLADSGIRTAADFTGVVRNPGQEAGVLFRLAGGGAVRVPGIGEVKAGRVERWRLTLLKQAKAAEPTRLSPAERGALKARFAAESAKLDAEHSYAIAERERAVVLLKDRHRAEHAALLERLTRERADAARERVEHDRAVKESAVRVRTAERGVRESRAAAEAFRRVTYRRYAFFALFGRG